MKVEWSATALADLNRFRLFLRERHPRIADRVARQIQERVALLSDFPLLGQTVRSEYREVVVATLNAKYVVRYQVREDMILIFRVFHGREDREEAT